MMTNSTPPNPGPPPDALAPAALALAAFALGQAIHVRDGEYWPAAVGWLAAAIACTAAAVLLPRRLAVVPWRGGAVEAVLGGAVVVQLVQLLLGPVSGRNPWSNDLPPGTSAVPFRVGILLAAAGVVCLWSRRRALLLPRAAVPLLLAAHFLLGVWLIRSTPDPHIDVYVFQQEASKALLNGENPYTVSFPDIYRSGAGGERAVYGDDLTEGGRVHFGFPYLPLSLVLALPGYALAGDHRYAQLAAMTLAGALIAFARPGRVAALAAALLLFTPRGFFILGRGWTEPFTAVLLALVVFLACRCRPPLVNTTAGSRCIDWGLPVAVGLFLATKQYLALAVPLVWLLLPRPVTARRAVSFGAKAALAGLLVTLPLVIPDPPAFWRSTVGVQVLAPYRTDALSFPNLWLHKRGLLPSDGSLPPREVLPPTWPAFAAAVLAIALCLWRAPRTPAGFAAALALVFLAFISLNKQAFANYYYFVLAALCCAIAAADNGAPATSLAPVRRGEGREGGPFAPPGDESPLSPTLSPACRGGGG
jgi:hypothetical protein